MERPPRCPVCNAPIEEDPDAGFRIPPQCPYAGTAFPELCALHDKIYFGRWRKMEAAPNDVRKGHGKLVRLLLLARGVVEREGTEPARKNLRNAEEALAMADPDGEPYSSVKFMDRALSYIHHAINDLLHERRAKPHSPSDYERHYDVVLPFKEDW